MYDEALWYGYLQMTSPEVARDKNTEDVFHVWFSEPPNGPVLDGNEDCDRYATRAEIDFYWHQRECDPTLEGVCRWGWVWNSRDRNHLLYHSSRL